MTDIEAIRERAAFYESDRPLSMTQDERDVCTLLAHIDKMEAENERLRAVLMRMGDMNPGCYTCEERRYKATAALRKDGEG